MALGVAANTIGKVIASTVFMSCLVHVPISDFLLVVKNGFVVGVRCQCNSEPPADGATTPLSQCHAWLHNAAWLGPRYTIPSAAHQQIEGGRDGESKGREGGREGGSDAVRLRGSGSGGRKGRLREG